MLGYAGNALQAPDFLGEVIDGHHGQEGVRQVAVHPQGYGVAQVLDECLQDRTPRRLQLLRSKYKPGRTLTAYYRIRSAGNLPDGRDIAVIWSVRPANESSDDSTETPESIRPQSGSGRLVGRSDDGRVKVLVSPADPSMPQLERLTRIAHIASLLEELTGRAVPMTPRTAIETVRYRPGQRHVLVARFGAGVGSVYVKTDRDGSGARAVPAAELAQENLSRRCPGARAVEPVGYSWQDSAALWRQASGRALSRLLLDRPADASTVVERVGQALRAIHEGPPVPGLAALEPIDSRDVAAEAAAVLRAGAHIRALLPAVGSVYATLVSEAVDALDEMPTEGVSLTHGDFKNDNILIHHGQPRILDFDRTCWADPAMDVGKFLADLAWWCPLRDLTALRNAFLAGYGSCDTVQWPRAGLWSVLFRLKITARRCAIHDADWPIRVRSHVAGARAALLMTRRS